MSSDGSGRRLAGGVVLNYSAFFAGKLIVFVNTVVLARLLAPEHFGIVAVGLLVVTFTELLFEAGAGAAVVWRPGDEDATAAVALALSLVGAVAALLVLFALAPVIAAFFHEPAAAEIIRVLAFCFLFSAPAAVFSGLLQRRMQFGLRVIPELAKAVTKGLVGIPLAALGFGAWSLAFGHVAGLAAAMLLLWLFSRWRVRLSFDRQIVRQILPYALNIAAIGALGVATKNIDYIIVGRVFDATALGLYVLAFTLVDLVVMGICWSASQVLFPALTPVGQDREAIARIFQNFLAGVSAVTIPASVGLVLIAGPFVLTFYGPNWAPAIPILQALGFYALIYAVGFNLGDIYKATGRPQILTRINLVNLVIAVPLLMAASRWGVVGIAIGQAAVAAVITAMHWTLARRFFGMSPRVLFDAVRGSVLATLIMAGAALAAGRLVQTLPAPVQLVTIMGVAIPVYAVATLFLSPEVVAAARGFLRRRGGSGSEAAVMPTGSGATLPSVKAASP